MGTHIEIESHADEVRAAFEESLGKALEEIGFVAEGYAAEMCPVDTGRLRNSITHSIEDDNRTVVIGTNVEYAPYVELGHHQEPGRYVPEIGKKLKADYVPPKPFLKPAVMEHMDEYKKILKQELGGQ